MKILILMGSPNPKGSTFLLADAFRQGAQDGGHVVQMIDVAKAHVSPCGGCVACGYDGPCVKRDDMARIGAALLEADMLVLATPLYYYGMSSQLKTVIDRFCAFNGRMQRKHMKSALLSVAWNADDWTFDALKAHYHKIRHLALTRATPACPEIQYNGFPEILAEAHFVAGLVIHRKIGCGNDLGLLL